MPRTPQERLYDLSGELHRQTVLEYLADHNLPVNGWVPKYVNAAIDTLFGLTEPDPLRPVPELTELPDWSTVHLDGAETGIARNNPIYPIRLLGATGVSFLSLYTSEYDNPYPKTEWLQVPPYSSSVTAPNKRLSVQLNYGQPLYPGSVNDRSSTATVFLRKGVPPFAIRDDTLEHSSATGNISTLSFRIIARVEHDFGAEATEILSGNACVTAMCALRAAKRTLRVLAQDSDSLDAE